MNAPVTSPWLGELLARMDNLDLFFFAGHLERWHAERLAEREDLIGFPAALDQLEYVKMYRSPHGWRVAASQIDLERQDLVPATRITVREVNLSRGRRVVISP